MILTRSMDDLDEIPITGPDRRPLEGVSWEKKPEIVPPENRIISLCYITLASTSHLLEAHQR